MPAAQRLAAAAAGGSSESAAAAAADAARAAAGGGALPLLRLPTVQSSEVVLASRTKRVFANAHTYHINSVSVNSDQQTFLSADDLRVNLWSLEVADQSFNIVDIKPANMEDLTEVITSAEFHPSHCNVFAYSSSKGCIRLADMRGAALCDRHAKAYEEADQSGGAKSFFSEIIASISDVRFSRDGRYLLSRDYMTVKLWDLAKEDKPVATMPVHEPLRQRLCDLYENDCIFDKFDCCMNGAATHVASGSYGNSFRVFSARGAGGSGDGSGGGGGGEGSDGGSGSGSGGGATEATLEATRDPMRRRLQAQAQAGGSGGGKGARFAARAKSMAAGLGGRQRSPEPGGDAAPVDFGSKLLHLAWHPEANVIACAASNSLYMYCAP